MGAVIDPKTEALNTAVAKLETDYSAFPTLHATLDSATSAANDATNAQTAAQKALDDQNTLVLADIQAVKDAASALTS